MNEKNWPVVTKIPLLWGDMDSFNHVNNIIYAKWCETSRIRLFKKMPWWNFGFTMEDLLKGDGIGPILASFNTNYRIPLTYPDTVHVHTRISRIGDTSFGIEDKILSDKNKKNVVFDANSVVVMINYKDGSKVHLSEDYRLSLEKLM